MGLIMHDVKIKITVYYVYSLKYLVIVIITTFIPRRKYFWLRQP
jgi:hypothetical protein